FQRYKVVLQERKERLFNGLIEPNQLRNCLQQEQDSVAEDVLPHQDGAESELPFVKIQKLVQEIMSILPQDTNLSYLEELLQELNKQSTSAAQATDVASKSHEQHSPASAKSSRSTMNKPSSHKRHRQTTPLQKAASATPKHSSSTFAMPKQPIQQKSTV